MNLTFKLIKVRNLYSMFFTKRTVLTYIAAFTSFINYSQNMQACFDVIHSAHVKNLGDNPLASVTADFNSDGKQDIAVTNMSSNNVSVLLGTGTGTLSAAVNYSVGSFPMSICMGDFNNDGNPDLAVGNQSSNNISILIGSASGTLSSSVNYTAGNGPQA